MAEHAIRLFNNKAGTFDVIHNSSRFGRNGNLGVADKDTRRGLTLLDAVRYMFDLRKRLERAGGSVEDFGFDVFGYENPDGSWCGVPEDWQTPKAEIQLALAEAEIDLLRERLAESGKN
jgi:hypothetical protein